MNLHRKHASTKLPALGAGGFTPDGLLPEELEAQDALALPDRKALSVISTLPDPQALLDLYADINLGLDLAAPVAAALAANLNIALPINASVSANVLSPDSISLATAKQGMIIHQSLDGTASATADQVSQIDQGEAAVGPTGSEIPSADPVAPEAPAASMAPGGEPIAAFPAEVTTAEAGAHGAPADGTPADTGIAADPSDGMATDGVTDTGTAPETSAGMTTDGSATVTSDGTTTDGTAAETSDGATFDGATAVSGSEGESAPDMSAGSDHAGPAEGNAPDLTGEVSR